MILILPYDYHFKQTYHFIVKFQESKKEFSLDLLTLLRTDIVHDVGRGKSFFGCFLERINIRDISCLIGYMI